MNEKTFTRCASVILGWLCVTSHAAFNCTESGLFADPDSNDCGSFIACDKNRDNNLTVRSYSCTNGTYFSPELKGCFSSYDCASKSMPFSTDPCKGFRNVDIPDEHSADCTKYFHCNFRIIAFNRTAVPIPHVVAKECPAGTAFSPRNKCDRKNQCSTYECNSTGDFENTNGNDCSTFIRCREYEASTKYSDDSLLYPEVTSCPSNATFNPFHRKCDSFYNCDGIDPHGGVDPCRNYNYDYPHVPNPYDSGSTSYISCKYFDDVTHRAMGGILKKYCPEDTLFSPYVNQCYHNYNPNETCSKDACSGGPGKYANYKSGNCESYIQCRDEVRKYGLYEPTYDIRYCPDGTLFDPDTRSCSKKFVCPAFSENYCYLQTISSTATTTTTTSSPPTTMTTTTSSPLKTMTITTSSPPPTTMTTTTSSPPTTTSE